jgi:hypothetical protein
LLRDLGVSTEQRRWLLRSARLFRVHDGVYTTVAGTLSSVQEATAACLAAPYAVLSFGTAGRLHGIRKAPFDRLEMTIPTGRNLWLPRIKVHRTNLLDPNDIVHQLDGLRLTSVERTLFDLAGVLDRYELQSAMQDCLKREVTTLAALAELAGRVAKRGRRGSADFVAALAREGANPIPAESDDELVLFRALDASPDVPTPERQVWIQLKSGAWIRADLGWRDVLLGWEVDPAHWHANPIRVQADKSRDVQARLVDWTVHRSTDIDVRDHVRATVAAIAAVYRSLARARAA